MKFFVAAIFSGILVNSGIPSSVVIVVACISKGTACIKAGPSYDWTSYPPLTTKMPFIRFDPAVSTLPGHKAQTEDSHIVVFISE